MRVFVILSVMLVTATTGIMGAACDSQWNFDRGTREWAKAERAVERARLKAERQADQEWRKAERKRFQAERNVDREWRRAERDQLKAERTARRSWEKAWRKYDRWR